MSINILLADDSITIQKVVGIIFGGEDYSLTVVDNGKAAVEKAREINPDVLLIDALMPGMSGYEVCEAVRAIPALSTKPILLLTGSFEPFDENKAKSCGADDFLAKPFESQQIITKVKELFDLGATRTGTSAPAAQPLEKEPVVPSFAEFDVDPAEATISEEPATSNDIWGAFTAPEETPAPVVETASISANTAVDEDIFAMITEEPEEQTTLLEASEPPKSENTGSQWIPVEEETFAFEEEASLEPTAAFNAPEPMIDDSAFEMDLSSDESPAVESVVTPELTVPAFDEVEAPAFAVQEAPPVQTATPEIVPATTAAPATMTEDQLRAALAGASKELIERIVWEVVPDLAETMIKEAIRKIKEGM